MKYVWKGPSTVAEIWHDPMPEDAGAVEPLFSGALIPDREIPADLPADHPQIKSWLAFGLIAPAPVAPAAPVKPRDKETTNG